MPAARGDSKHPSVAEATVTHPANSRVYFVRKAVTRDTSCGTQQGELMGIPRRETGDPFAHPDLPDGG